MVESMLEPVHPLGYHEVRPFYSSSSQNFESVKGCSDQYYNPFDLGSQLSSGLAPCTDYALKCPRVKFEVLPV